MPENNININNNNPKLYNSSTNQTCILENGWLLAYQPAREGSTLLKFLLQRALFLPKLPL